MKPNLFYRSRILSYRGKDREVIAFADMRGTKDIPIWKQPLPFLYIDWSPMFQNEECPTWLYNRILNSEIGRLDDNEIPYRTRLGFHTRTDSSSIASDFPDYLPWHSVRNFIPDQDGFCKICGKDIQNSGFWCSDSCREKFLDEIQTHHVIRLMRKIRRLPICTCCGVYVTNDKWLIEQASLNNLPEVKNKRGHHLNYEEDETITVCASCHASIHHSDKEEFEEYKPEDEKKDARKCKLIPCSDCDGKTRVPVEYKDETGICYKCRQKREREKSKSKKIRSRGYPRYNADIACRDKFGM